jgi:hypothetical protein
VAVDRLADNLRRVRERIDAAARDAGRRPGDVSLLAVSKTWPADDVRRLAGLGQLDFAENKAQELTGKAAELADLTLRWHFVGQLQRNKVNAVTSVGAVVHSVDSVRLADALARAGERDGRPVPVFVQVDLDDEQQDPGRGGVATGLVAELADHVAGLPGLTLQGLMAVAPRGVEPGPAFTRLAALADRVRADHPEATELSAGMSGDLEQAVAAGATLVRVGTALFGARPLPSG